VLALLALALPAWSQQSRVGVVAMLQGTATVSRTTLPAPSLLRFKDDVFLHDRINTAERSAVRVLLGAKATVTARERSILTITELPSTSTVFLAAGRAAVAVSNARMKPGETVELKTPNAVVAIRGTLVVAEVSPTRSTITVVRGLVEVTKLDPATGRAVGPPVSVGALERVTVTDARPILAPEAISPETARSLVSDFTFVPQNAPASTLAGLTQAVKDAAIADVTRTLISPGGTTADIGSVVSGATGTPTTVTGTTTSVTGTTTTVVTGAVDALAGGVVSGATTTSGGTTTTGRSIPPTLSAPAVPPAPTRLLGPIAPTVPPILTGPVTKPVTNGAVPSLAPKQ
jgi:hypothetical protein